MPTESEQLVYRLAAIDPGESFCGLAEFDLAPLGGRLIGDGFVDQSRRGKIRLMAARTLRPDDLYGELERMAPLLYAVVLERYSLYPWLAREQGFSELLTAQCCGVVKDIAIRRFKVPVFVQQDAKENLRGGRAQAEKAGFRMQDRVLGSGRWKYRGPDFVLPGKPHRRDACAHGVMFATTNKQSPLLA
jgi:hypothetical protein